MQMPNTPPRVIAIAEALLANLIWASTFVLVKIGLNDLGPLSLAGLRYFSAFLLLAPFMLMNGKKSSPLSLSFYIRLFAIGLCAYPIANGALFWGLKFTSATTASLILALTPLFILILGVFWLREIPTLLQVIGLVIATGGTLLFFLPGVDAGEPLGIALVLIAMTGLGLFGILGRQIARVQSVDTLTLTTIPLAFGGGLLLFIAFASEGLPQFTWKAAIVVIWLAIFNTVVAYMAFNHSLQVLTAFETNIMMNLAPLATAALAWGILGEKLEAVQIVGMIVVIAGVLFVQLRKI